MPVEIIVFLLKECKSCEGICPVVSLPLLKTVEPVQVYSWIYDSVPWTGKDLS